MVKLTLFKLFFQKKCFPNSQKAYTFAPTKEINNTIVLHFKKLKKMKKLVLMFAAVAAISFASCGNKAEAPAEAADSAAADTAVVDTTDSVAADTAAADTAAADTANA